MDQQVLWVGRWLAERYSRLLDANIRWREMSFRVTCTHPSFWGVPLTRGDVSEMGFGRCGGSGPTGLRWVYSRLLKGHMEPSGLGLGLTTCSPWLSLKKGLTLLALS